MTLPSKPTPSSSSQQQSTHHHALHLSPSSSSVTAPSNRRLYSLTFLSFVGLLSFRGSTTFWGVGRHTQSVLEVENKLQPQLPIEYRTAGELRMDWRNLPLQSQLAQEFKAHQNNCKLPLHYFVPRNAAGLGSDLHVYGMALCHAHRMKVRMWHASPWMYLDRKICTEALQDREIAPSQSSMSCYFPTLELQCPGDEVEAERIMNETKRLAQTNPRATPRQKLIWETHEDQLCWSMLNRPGYSGLFKIFDVRAAITELQFSKVSPVLYKEAQRQHRLVFGKTGVPPSHQLITVHVRWGDKGAEMSLQPISVYIEAVEEIAAQRKLRANEVHIFLASEDPRAVQQFKAAMNPAWTVYVDQFFVEMLPHRNNRTQAVANVAMSGYGHTGLLALGSILVSMEADSYVLSTGSNWSRLMNELRKNLLRPRQCPTPQGIAPSYAINGTISTDCTTLIDVMPTTSWMETGDEPKKNERHKLILQKLKSLQEYRVGQGGNAGITSTIKQHRPRTVWVDTKTVQQPESARIKEERNKMVKYPRLQRHQAGFRERRRRRLMKFARG